MNRLLPIFAFLLIFWSGAVSAQFPNPLDIQNDFDKTFEKYYTAALKFVDAIGLELDARVSNFVKVHQRLLDQLNSLKNLNGTVLDEANVKIINEAVTLINGLLNGYRTTLDRNIVVNELNRHLNVLKSNITQAQGLINELKNWVTQLPILGQCWTSVRDELGNIVNNGFNQARDAAAFAISNANATLNIIEFLVNSTIDANNVSISACQLNLNTINSCINSFLNIAQITLPANINFWASTIESSVRNNLMIADSLVQAASAMGMSSIPSITARIQTCLRNVGNIFI